VQRSLETIYALGRLGFGAAGLAAPNTLGRLLVGKYVHIPLVRIGFRLYGTRDVVLGLGTLRAVGNGDGVGTWLAAGVASDLLDAAIQLREWSDLPSDRRLPGVLAALGAAGAGGLLLAGRRGGREALAP
jgi:hypothetical protein